MNFFRIPLPVILRIYLLFSSPILMWQATSIPTPLVGKTQDTQGDVNRESFLCKVTVGQEGDTPLGQRKSKLTVSL